MKIRVHIERLVLDGVPVGPGGAQRVRAAVELELTRLLAARRLRFTGGAWPGWQAPAIRVTAPSSPAELGERIARSVYRSLGRNL